MRDNKNRATANLLIYGFSALIAAVMIRMFVKKVHLPIPHHCVFIAFAGIVITVVKSVVPSIRTEEKAVREMLFILDMFEYVYVPLVFYKIAFFVDYQAFDKVLSQICIISFFATPCAMVFIGFVMRIIIDKEWEVAEAFLFGSMCMTIYPGSLVNLLESTAYVTKHVIHLLEGEALLGLLLATNVHEMVTYHLQGVVIYWYQIVFASLRRIILSILVGIFCGFIGVRLMRIFYNDPTLLLLITISMSFISNSLSETYGDSSFGVVITGAFMSREKAYLTHPVNNLLTVSWKLLGFCTNVILYAACASHLILYSLNYVKFYDFCLVFLTYIIDVTARTLIFYCFSPILSRLGAGMSYTHRAICVGGGIKNAFNLGLTMYVFKIFREESHQNEIFFLHSCMLFFFTNLMTAFCKQWLKHLGVTQPNLVSKINMHNCMKYILQTRDRLIFLSKMNKSFVDVNWTIVENTTNIKHPYRQFFDEKDDIEDYVDLRISVCPKCETRVLSDPTEKEFIEMTRETKLRILQAKKVMFRKLFEDELITKKVLRTLINAVEAAIETKEAVTNSKFISDLLNNESWIERRIRHQLQKLDVSTTAKRTPPKKLIRRLCFNIVTYKYFEYMFLLIVLCDSAFLILMDLNDKNIRDKTVNYFKYPDWMKPLVSTIFSVIYFLEFVMKVLAFTKKSVFKDGICTYFKSIWNILDFLILLLTLFSLICEYVYMLKPPAFDISEALYRTISTIILFRMTRLLKLLRFVHKMTFETMLFIETRYDLQAIYAFEVGEAYANVERDVSRLVEFMTDNALIRDTLKKHLETERATVIKLLITKRKQRPDIASVSKSKQAIITILNYMSNAMFDLKSLGWLDQVEHDHFTKLMMEHYKKVMSMRLVEFVLPSPLMIFREVQWLENNKLISDFLFEHISVEKFDPGQIIVNSGDALNGIYIVITGVFRLTYTPNEESLANLHHFGALPIVDYMPSIMYTDSYWDYIMPGNCIGELACLVLRPYSCTIVADTYSQVYFMSEDAIQKAMSLDPDPITGLECRIWKAVAIRIGRYILYNVPTYSVLRQEKITLALERSFVPNLAEYRIFECIENMIEDVLLIDGAVVDFHSRKVYYGPCYISRTIRKLILTNSNVIDGQTNIKTRLLIIPEKDVPHGDIMKLQKKRPIREGGGVFGLQRDSLPNISHFK